MDTMDSRYASFRELAGLRERTATLEASLPAISQALTRIEASMAAITATARQVPTAPDHVALALQRAADVFERGKGGANPFLVSAITVVALALGAVLGKLFL